MAKVIYIVAFLPAAGAILAHSLACEIHKVTVERIWQRSPETRDRFVWSHAYCNAVGAPVRWFTQ